MSENTAKNTQIHTSLGRKILKGLLREVAIPVSMALLVIFFVIQAFKIPSSSMEDSLLIGDFLLGLKFVYGSPIPFSESRLPGLQDPEPGDVVIFRYPGDPEIPDYEPTRYSHVANLLMFGNLYWDNSPVEGGNRLVHYPIGPKDFIKRCVAKSGQEVWIKEGVLHIDGKIREVPGFGKYQMPFREPTPRDQFGPLKVPSVGDKLPLTNVPFVQLWFNRSLMIQENPGKKVELHAHLLRGNVNVDTMMFNNFRIMLWPHKSYLGSILYSQMDPMAQRQVQVYDSLSGLMPFKAIQEAVKTGFIPQSPERVDGAMLPSWLVRSVGYEVFDPTQIEDVERHIQSLNSQGDSLRLEWKVTIDGQAVTQYTLKQPAYFMMGDNRDNSADSRYWGFVSHRNIKAKAFIIYYSIDNVDNGFAFTNPISWFSLPGKIRWSRFGKLIQDIGRPWQQ